MTLTYNAGDRPPEKGSELKGPVPVGAESAAQTIVSSKPPSGNKVDHFAFIQAVTGVVGVAPIKSLRVLIVEDDLTIGPLLAEVLNDLGHIICAIQTNANAAVKAARLYCPDLMIVDVKLGGSSGISAVREILEQGVCAPCFRDRRRSERAANW